MSKLVETEACDGTCECACEYEQQDHPYSQRCIPSCLLPNQRGAK